VEVVKDPGNIWKVGLTGFAKRLDVGGACERMREGERGGRERDREGERERERTVRLTSDFMDWGYSSVVGQMLSIFETLGSFPAPK
jgi:hypothetical protein